MPTDAGHPSEEMSQGWGRQKTEASLGECGGVTSSPGDVSGGGGDMISNGTTTT